MRQHFITQTDLDHAYNYATVMSGTYIDTEGAHFPGMPGIVAHDCPWAELAVEVDGGLMVYESRHD
jgi:hypothetical protein